MDPHQTVVIREEVQPPNTTLQTHNKNQQHKPNKQRHTQPHLSPFPHLYQVFISNMQTQSLITSADC